MEAIKVDTCPFCGDTASLVWQGGRYGKFGFVECDLCGARSKAFGNVVGETSEPGFWTQQAFRRAVDAWNRRVT